MSRRRLLRRALGGAGVAAVLLALTALADEVTDTTAVSAGIETCGKVVNSLPTDVMASLLSDLKAAAAPRGGTPPPAAPGGVAPGSAAAAVVEARAPAPVAKVIADAEQQVSWAEGYKRQAAAALERARATQDPRVAAVHLKDAMQKAAMARNLIDRVVAMVDPKAPEPAGRMPAQRVGIEAEGYALRQLMQSARLGEKYQGRLGFGEHAGWNRGADPVDLRPQTQQLFISAGNAVDLRPLARALQQAAPQAAREPLFKPVPVPGTSSRVLQPSAPLLQALADPLTRQRLEQVGGVAMQVTVDLLAFSGVPGFRHGGPSSVVEQPVLISLVELYRRLQPHARDAESWRRLPDALRFPGAIERIHGFVLDASTRDVLLVGAGARRRETRIDVDDVIVGLRVVWRDGREPAVSLDALPAAPAGDQFASFINVPDDSHFAKVMIEADYAMKKVSFGAVRVEAPGFRSFLGVYRGRPQQAEAQTYDRQWLTPMPLGPGDIRLSATGRTILFDAAVRAQSERMLRVGGGVAGTGRGADLDVEVAESFTKAYDAFERSEAIEPRGIFLRLHGLVDIVTTAQMLRRFGIGLEILDRFSELPIRQLDGAEAVPSRFPAVMVEYAREDLGGGRYRRHVIAGGVELRPRASRRALDRYRDVTTATLEHAADSFPRSRGFAQPVPITLALSRGGGTTAEQSFTAGYLALSAGETESARRHLTQATALDPEFADAWAYLSLAEAEAKRWPAAFAAIRNALRMEPEERLFQQIAFLIQLLADAGRYNPAAWNEDARRDQSREYSRQAMLALLADRERDTVTLANRALELWEDNPDAWFVRAETGQQTIDQAVRDYDRAIRLYRRAMRESGNQEGRKKLAFALASSAFYRSVAVEMLDFDRVLANPAAVQQLFVRLGGAAQDAAEAAALDPAQPLALSAEAYARRLRAVILQSTGQPFNYAPARQLADRLVRQFPDFALGHVIRAEVLALMDDLPGAIKALSEAVRLSPQTKNALVTRAALQAQAGNCAAARQDLERARELGLPVARPLAEMVQQCR